MAYIYDFEYTVHSVIDNLNEVGLPDGDPEISITTVEGFLKRTDDTLLITYAEQADGGKVLTDIEISGESVSLRRRGGVVFDLTFREGETVDTVYSVPPYSFDCTVRTKRIRNGITKDGGELTLLYSMNIGGQEKNVRMKISARPRARA